jgi:hypothetical protein
LNGKEAISPRRIRQAVFLKILALDLEAVATVALLLGEARVPLVGALDLEAIRRVVLDPA